jgi:hypothetical protein
MAISSMTFRAASSSKIRCPSDMPTPTDPDGTPMTFIGQFAAARSAT